MADISYGSNVPEHEQRPHDHGAMRTLGVVTNWAGALISLGLIVGVGVWSYKTISRDVSGVPVVRAASGLPMRVAPENPGGEPALHQGLAVNAVAAVGAAEKPADKLVLAPPPVSLDDEDVPVPVAVARVAAEEAVAPTAFSEAPQMASIRELADRLTAGATPLDNPIDGVQGEEAGQEAAASAPIPTEAAAPIASAEALAPVPKGGLKVSLRPNPRPRGLAAAPEVSNDVASAADIEMAVSSVTPGTRLVQLGAFDSPEVARNEWGKLNDKFGDYLEGKQRVIQKAQSGGRTFYRLRAVGFVDLNDARRFCSALVAEKADCIPVTAR